MDKPDAHDHIERTYYPNGQIESEIPYLNGKEDGVARLWYINGFLQSEYSMVASTKHGFCRKWDLEGNLDSECMYTNGSGLFKCFYKNSQISSEMGIKDGAPHGRNRCWDEEGALVVERYYIKGKTISKKRYAKAAEEDSTLPQYDEDGVISWEEENKEFIAAERKAFQQSQLKAEPRDDEAYYKDLLSRGKHAEVLKWLKEDTTDEYRRTLGEGMSNSDSTEFIMELYATGALDVQAIEIMVEPEGEEYTSKLIIQLHSDPKSRKKVFDICEPITIELGFTPELDTGQKYLLLSLD